MRMLSFILNLLVDYKCLRFLWKIKKVEKYLNYKIEKSLKHYFQHIKFLLRHLQCIIIIIIIIVNSLHKD